MSDDDVDNTLENIAMAYAEDSPIFVKLSNEYSGDFNKLGEYLKKCVKLMSQLCDDISSTSKHLDELSKHLFHNNSKILFKDDVIFSEVKSLFADTFKGFAISQQTLVSTLHEKFIRPLDTFYKESITKALEAHTQCQRDRSSHDDLVVRYLQCDVPSSFSRGSHADKRAYDVVLQRRKFELSRLDLVKHFNEIESRKSYVFSAACYGAMKEMRNFHSACVQKLQPLESIQEQHTIRQQYERRQLKTSRYWFDAKRRDVEAVLDTMVERVETQLPPHLLSNTSMGSAVESLLFSAAPGQSDESNVTSVASSALSRIGAMGANLFGASKKDEKGVNVQEKLRKGSDPDSSGSDPKVSEMEMRLKALDISQLQELYMPYNENLRNQAQHLVHSNAGVIKQGYVLEKTISKLTSTVSWTRQWLVLDESRLSLIAIKEGGYVDSPLGVREVCDMMLASVRELKTAETPYCFEIAYANLRSFTFQAEGPKEYSLWIDALRVAIEKRLISGPDSVNPQQQRISLTSMLITDCVDDQSDIISSGDSEKKIAGGIGSKFLNSSSATPALHSLSPKERAIMVDTILKANSQCAECGKKDPDWISLNLGCLVCIECSGVHRSLGVHISKVRSLTLDDLEPEEYEILKRIGNTVSNSIWEARIVQDSDSTEAQEKPHPPDVYAVRQKFIKAKYQDRKYLLANEDYMADLFSALQESDTDHYSSNSSEPTGSSFSPIDTKLVRKLLIQACETDDVTLLMKVVAHGGPDILGYHVAVEHDDECAGCSTLTSDVEGDKTEIQPSEKSISKKDVSSDDEEEDDDKNSDENDESTPKSFSETSKSNCTSSYGALPPLLIAAQNGSLCSVVLLIMNGADLFASNNPTATEVEEEDVITAAAELAKANGHDIIASYITRKADLMRPSAASRRLPSSSSVPSLESSPTISSKVKRVESGQSMLSFQPSSSSRKNKSGNTSDIGEKLRMASETNAPIYEKTKSGFARIFGGGADSSSGSGSRVSEIDRDSISVVEATAERKKNSMFSSALRSLDPRR